MITSLGVLRGTLMQGDNARGAVAVKNVIRFTRTLLVTGATAAIAAYAAPVAFASGSSHKSSFKGTIKVGAFTDVTGALAVASGMQGGLAYFDAVNASGGVDGYKIVPTEYDTQSAPNGAVQAIRRAIAAKPAMILGASFVAGSGLPTLANSGIPSVGDGFAPGWTGHKTLFPVGGDQVLHYSDVMLVVDKVYGHATKIALLGGTVGLPDAYNLIKQAPRAGVQLVMQNLDVPLVPTSAQFLSLAEQVKASGAQGVVALGVEGLAQLQIDLNQLGASVAVIATDQGPPTAAENGVLFSNAWATPYVKHDPGVNAYIAAMKRFGYGKLIYTASYGLMRWGEAALLVHALEKAGPPFSRHAIVKALSATKNFTADGVVPAASFPAFQKVGPSCQVVNEVVNGKWVSLTNGNYPFACGGPSLPDPTS
jgi:ABC-type branched-subunit amino acid transport system substrate-binding protein